MTARRMVIFLIVVLSLWAAMYLYVLWRLSSVPGIATHVTPRQLCLAAVALWASYPLARILQAQGWSAVAQPLEWVSANWIGVLFLLLSALLVTEVVTSGRLTAAGGRAEAARLGDRPRPLAGGCGAGARSTAAGMAGLRGCPAVVAARGDLADHAAQCCSSGSPRHPTHTVTCICTPPTPK